MHNIKTTWCRLLSDLSSLHQLEFDRRLQLDEFVDNLDSDSTFDVHDTINDDVSLDGAGA